MGAPSFLSSGYSGVEWAGASAAGVGEGLIRSGERTQLSGVGAGSMRTMVGSVRYSLTVGRHPIAQPSFSVA